MDSIKCAKQNIRAIISKSCVPEDSLHSENVLKWIIKLKSDADEALQIAAIAHDIDRADGHKKVKRNNFLDYNKFKLEHAKNSANILKGIIHSCSFCMSSMHTSVSIIVCINVFKCRMINVTIIYSYFPSVYYLYILQS